jgi:hypothetical protein
VQEQQVLDYLLTSVSLDVLVQITALPSAAKVWKHIKTSFASQSHARVINTGMALATTQKSTVAEYVSKMKTLVDEMASADKKWDDEELSSYILAGLDFEYNPFASSIAAWVEPISFGELYSQFPAHENRLDIQNGGQHRQISSVNNATSGRGGYSRGRGGCSTGMRGGSNGGGRCCGDFSNKSQNWFLPC